MLRLALSSLLLGSLNFFGCADETVSCEDDVLGCDETLTFELAADCSEAEMAGEIELVIGNGNGEGGFRALESDELDLVEIIELPDHPFFVAVQFHPEFRSKPTKAHPLFREFVKAACARKRGK